MKFLEGIKTLFLKRLGSFLGVFFVIGLLTKEIVVPFLNSSIYFRDMLGHFFAAWYQKNHIFPEIFGWNPYFFGGYMQNRFYPHY